jgi:cob(I)alamin adenosyltransferase
VFQVYTGNGKGKTTAVFGLALRASGHGWRVLIIQFMKGDPNYGEVVAGRKVANLEIVQTGLTTFVERGNLSDEDLAEARRGMAEAGKALSSGKYRLVILDEINVAIDYGLVKLDEALALVERCPQDVELVFTGRLARPEVVKRADLVSEILEIKHPMQRGIVNRVGIDH